MDKYPQNRRPFGVQDELEFGQSSSSEEELQKEDVPSKINNESNSADYAFMTHNAKFVLHGTRKNVIEENKGMESMKIVYLSKRIRELLACLNAEKSKSERLAQKISALESQLQESTSVVSGNFNSDEEKRQQIKATQEKLTKAESAISVLKNQNHMLLSELKTAKIILERETGEEIPNLNVWLRNIRSDASMEALEKNGIFPTWRGRQQQIFLLKDRVRLLESKLADRTGRSGPRGLRSNLTKSCEEISGATSLGLEDVCYSDTDRYNKRSAGSNETDELVKPRTCATQMQLQRENDTLKAELELFKNKFSNSRTIEKGVKQDLKEARQQVRWLVGKGKNDDELIKSLVERNSQMQSEAKDVGAKLTTLEASLRAKTDECTSLEMQRKAEVVKLQEIIAEKEDKIKELEKSLSAPRRDCEKDSVRREDKCNLRTRRSGSDDDRVHTPDSSGDKGNEGDLAKQLSIITIERDGLRKLIHSMEDRQQKLLDANQKLELTCTTMRHKLGDAAQPFTKTPRMCNNHAPSKATGAEQIKQENPQSVEFLCTKDFLQKTISNAGLTASASTLVSKRMQQLQSALSASRDEVQALESKTQKIATARKEDFTILAQIVKDIRDSVANEG
ncbi:unnamed protein product [Calicophoron daubneyi]|uniref:Coiled-coil domain-containing protein 13 n=1 Tax=Calicophoron daubneyi TaxID=300641 RepID=A0AAV2TE95_CALDB